MHFNAERNAGPDQPETKKVLEPRIKTTSGLTLLDLLLAQIQRVLEGSAPCVVFQWVFIKVLWEAPIPELSSPSVDSYSSSERVTVSRATRSDTS